MGENNQPMYNMNKFIYSFGFILALSLANGMKDQEKVDGYKPMGRGSCMDFRGKMYSYLQRTVEFPSAEACGKGECERFGDSGHYRGFEYSVAKRCTCLFDMEKVPVVPTQSDAAQQYVGNQDAGTDFVAKTSSVPGTDCYQYKRNSAVGMGRRVRV